MTDEEINQNFKERLGYCCTIWVCLVMPILFVAFMFAIYYGANLNPGDYLSSIYIYIIIQACCCLFLGVICVDFITTTQAHEQKEDIEKGNTNVSNYQQEINQQYPERDPCIICLENVRSVKLNCGHTPFCYPCAHQIQEQYRVCPLCQVPITDIREEFVSLNDYSPIIPPTIIQDYDQESEQDQESELEMTYDTESE